MWVPSHIGIEGNEEADNLASSAHRASSPASSSDLLTASELKNSMKKDWLESLHSSNHLLIGVYHLRFGFFPWKFHNNRKISSALHRIRSGHNRLKGHTSRFQTPDDGDPFFEPDCWCRYGCDAIENADHLIISCPHLNPSRLFLQNFIRRHNCNFDQATLSGCNPEVSAFLNFKIRDKLVKFLIHSEILPLI